jgi:hypothetical protein
MERGGRGLDSKFSRYFKDLSKEDNSTLISLRLCDKAINFLTEKKTKIYDKSYSDGLFEFIGVKNDEVKKTIYIKKMLQNDDELIYLSNLRNLVEEKVNIRIKNRLKKIEDLYLNLYNEMIIIVKEILMDDEYSNNFIFPLLDNKDFVDITNEKMFAKMNEKQYNKLAGRRSYYNQLLKIMGKQIGIPNLTSHKSRHSYTSILIKNN